MLIFLFLVAIGIIELAFLLLGYQLDTIRQDIELARSESRRHRIRNENVLAPCPDIGAEDKPSD